MQTIRTKAYAKINAYLEVTGRREDGYHTILSHMQAVTLCDTLTLQWEQNSATPLTIRLDVSDPSVPCDESNLVCRAVRAFAQASQERGQVFGGTLSISLEKQIPMAAGLAGGSADAAAALRGVNELLGNPLTTDELCDIAATLGADIPFCVRCTESRGGAMTARGIGELLCSAPSLPSSLYLVIACHGEGVSTPWAYRKLDEQPLLSEAEAERDYKAFLSALETGDVKAFAACSVNCFERVVLPERREAAWLVKEMKENGAILARMSGSGPSVVGFFSDEQAATACTRALLDQGVRAYVCRPLEI